MPATWRRFNAIVHGLVQGVGYRMFAQREGRRLQLDGWVRNLPDGSVEVAAEGPEPQLLVLLGRLRQGPSGAHVTGMDIEWGDAERAGGGFSIRY